MLNSDTNFQDRLCGFADDCECLRCIDTGVWLTPRGEVNVCPNILLRLPHPEPNPAASIFRRAALRLSETGCQIFSQPFYLARFLTRFTSAQPCPRTEIFRSVFDAADHSESFRLRRFHSLVEELRRVWLLPVGSRKEVPSGYWLITELDDYKQWFARTASAPVTQLSTLHRNARHNFPVFAEQIELDFWGDFSDAELHSRENGREF
ncbi:MAG: hypothetical protein KIS76_03985 [Pyrinomonadaceae bacterium]|nr:hypothetical protein [Pyrinomonadaceae bacterium]